MGYTPVFDSVFKGSLYGKWPDTAAWLCLLALADFRGHIDVAPEAISGMTGMPLKDLLSCIERFMQPDPRSRSLAEEGRRLVPIDPSRPWGWRVVNIGLYRERASGQNQVADGRNAEKVRRYKERHRQTPEDTAGHQGDTDSYSYSNTDKSKKARAKRASRVPLDFQPDLEFARTQIPDLDVEREVQKFRDWEFKTPRSDWPATWRTWIQHCRETGKYAKRQEAPRRGLPTLNA